jgi:hypothetical protein
MGLTEPEPAEPLSLDEALRRIAAWNRLVGARAAPCGWPTCPEHGSRR